jgi:hypothetical protein
LAKKPRSLIPSPLEQIADLTTDFAQSANRLKGREVDEARDLVEEVMAELRAALATLDPIRQPTSIFNPANPRTVGLFVSIALLAQERQPLGGVPRSYGSGVYAIYYNGDFSAYRPLIGTEHPIYVGKADPATADAKTAKEQDQRLSRRLREHAKAIARAENLRIDDFTCRQLVVASGLQTAAEIYLIDLFKPIWNKEIKIAFGIGKHGDSPTTRANLRSPWDTLHYGRNWAHRDLAMRDQASEVDIIAKIARHFSSYPPFKNIDQVLHRFYEDLKQS